MKCPRCHTEISRQLRFCPICGYNVEGLAEELAEEPLEEVDEEVFEDNIDEQFDEVVDETIYDEMPMDFEDQYIEEDDIELDDDEVEPEFVEVTPAPVSEYRAEAEFELEPEGDEEPYEVDEEPYEVDEEPYEVVDEPYEDYEDYEEASTDLAPRARTVADDAYGHAKAYERGGIRALLKRWRTVLIALGCVIALVLAGISSIEWNKSQQQAEEANATAEAKESDIRTPVPIGVAIDLEGYDEAHMTPIPLRVKGSAATGEAVDELVLFAHPNIDALSLLKGTYIVELGGPVLSDFGDLYEGTVDSFSLAILDEGITVNGRAVDPNETRPLHFIFTRIEPQNVSDGVLDMARSWMLKAEIVNYQSYVDAVIGKRQEAIDRLAAEQAAKEEAERKAAEEAAKKAEEQKKKEEEEKQKREQQEKDSTEDSTEGTTEDTETTGDTQDTYDQNYGGDTSYYGSNEGTYDYDSYDSYGNYTTDDSYSDYGYDNYGYGYDDSY